MSLCSVDWPRTDDELVSLCFQLFRPPSDFSFHLQNKYTSMGAHSDKEVKDSHRVKINVCCVVQKSSAIDNVQRKARRKAQNVKRLRHFTRYKRLDGSPTKTAISSQFGFIFS